MTMMNGVNFFPPCTPNLALEEINFVIHSVVGLLTVRCIISPLIQIPPLNSADVVTSTR